MKKTKIPSELLLFTEPKERKWEKLKRYFREWRDFRKQKQSYENVISLITILANKESLKLMVQMSFADKMFWTYKKFSVISFISKLEVFWSVETEFLDFLKRQLYDYIDRQNQNDANNFNDVFEGIYEIVHRTTTYYLKTHYSDKYQRDKFLK
ncbi:hypothetical protein [Mycoplasma sp. 2248]|uniref:hypothetical protein n=1 Tax=Mycoplasma sp. 2248 TaxID=3108528 RepID=UPI002B1D96CB|nr:hypothetical protein [Mycoplasma sp. 2248]MEA4191260.1 hypothetical protein [Mycoplasma sp. 2248]